MDEQHDFVFKTSDFFTQVYQEYDEIIFLGLLPARSFLNFAHHHRVLPIVNFWFDFCKPNVNSKNPNSSFILNFNICNNVS